MQLFVIDTSTWKQETVKESRFAGSQSSAFFLQKVWLPWYPPGVEAYSVLFTAELKLGQVILFLPAWTPRSEL